MNMSVWSESRQPYILSGKMILVPHRHGPEARLEITTASLYVSCIRFWQLFDAVLQTLCSLLL